MFRFKNKRLLKKLKLKKKIQKTAKCYKFIQANKLYFSFNILNILVYLIQPWKNYRNAANIYTDSI